MANQLSTVSQLKGMLSNENVKSRFKEILGQKAPAYISSIISATSANPQLAENCDPASIVSSAVVAATLDLPINPSLGIAYIVPFYDSKTRTTKAQLQLGWRAFVQLALRSNEYATMDVTDVYEGEIRSINKFTGEIEYGEKISDKVIGYFAFFRTKAGLYKHMYMTVEEIEKHAKQYSQTYRKGFGVWTTNFDAMARKTVIKRLISNWGMLSVEMQRAKTFDQASIKSNLIETSIDEAEVEYVDNIKPTPADIASIAKDAVDAEVIE